MQATIREVPIRKLKIVIDLENPLNPALTYEDFREKYGEEPKPPRYKVLNLELLVCPEDQSVVLASECSKCPRFIRRRNDNIYCKETAML